MKNILVVDNNGLRRNAIERSLHLVSRLSGIVIRPHAEIVVTGLSKNEIADLLQKCTVDFRRVLRECPNRIHDLSDTALVILHSTEVSQSCTGPFADWAVSCDVPVLKIHGSSLSEEFGPNGCWYRYPKIVSENSQPEWEAFFDAWGNDLAFSRVGECWKFLLPVEQEIWVLREALPLDILLQGYLIANPKSSEKKQSKDSVRSARSGVTQPPRPIKIVLGQYFDGGISNLLYSDKMDEAVDRIEKRFAGGKPSLGEILNRDRSVKANGAFRRVVEIVRNRNDRACATSEWPDGFAGGSTEDIRDLFDAAHKEFVLACEKVKEYLTP